MGKLSELGTKATPVGADLLTGLDSEDSNIQTKNKNFLLSSLWSAIFGTRDTDDIPEGTNLYYTDARVDANSTVVSLGTDKANKTNVLELDNTTTYTPTADYHPATKSYVDIGVSNIKVDGLIKVLDAAEDMSVLSCYRKGNPEITIGTTNVVNLYTDTSTNSGPGNYTETTIYTATAGTVAAGEQYFRLRSDLYHSFTGGNGGIRLRVYEGSTVIFERVEELSFNPGWTSYDDIIQFNVNGTDDITISIYQYERAVQYRNIYFDTFDYIRENTEKFYLSRADDTDKLDVDGIVITTANAGDTFEGSFEGIVEGFTALNPDNGTVFVVDSTIEGKLYDDVLIADILLSDNIGETLYLQDDGTIGLTAGTNSVIIGTVFSETAIKLNI